MLGGDEGAIGIELHTVYANFTMITRLIIGVIAVYAMVNYRTTHHVPVSATPSCVPFRRYFSIHLPCRQQVAS